MDVNEVGYAFGIVFCRSPLREFDFAPGTMHVEENEEIDRPIATILVIVTFEPARLGRDWLTDLADELHRTIVEAYDRPLDRALRHRDQARSPSGRRIRHRPAECTTCLCARV